MSASERRSLLLLILASLAVFLVDLGQPLGLHQNDEDFYFGVAREMFARGDMVVPWWEGHLAFEKPPLLYWLMMGCMGMLGPVLLAARLPVALCSIATVVGTAFLGARLFSWRAGLGAAFIVLSSFGMLQYGRVGMMDVPLTLLVLLVAWGAWRFMEGWSPGAVVAGAAMGTATMLKGPVGALIPALALGAWGVSTWWTRRQQAGGAAGLPPGAGRSLALGGVVALALVAAWPVALALRGLGPAWFQHFIVGENLGKFEGPGNSIASMVEGFLVLLSPWTLLLLGGMALSLRRAVVLRPAVQLLLAFVVAPLVVYSLPRVKWAQYLLPSLPYLALLLGRAWEEAVEAPATVQARLLRLLAGVTAVVLLMGAGWLALGLHLFAVTSERVLLGAAALGLGLAGLALLRGPRLALAGGCIGAVLVAALCLAPSLTMQRVPVELQGLSQGRAMVTYNVPPYFLMVQLRRQVGSISAPQAFREAFGRGDLVVVGQTELQGLVAQGALDMREARVLICWRKWRRHLGAQDMARTVLGGKLEDLTEPVWVLERLQASRS